MTATRGGSRLAAGGERRATVGTMVKGWRMLLVDRRQPTRCQVSHAVELLRMSSEEDVLYVMYFVTMLANFTTIFLSIVNTMYYNKGATMYGSKKVLYSLFFFNQTTYLQSFLVTYQEIKLVIKNC